MSIKIYKYKLPIRNGIVTIKMPFDLEICDFDQQQD